MGFGALPLDRDPLRIEGLIQAGLPAIRQVGGRGLIQVLAGAADGRGGGGHLWVVAQGGAGGPRQGRKDQTVKPHRHHEAGLLEAAQGLARIGRPQGAAALPQGRGEQAVPLQLVQQT